MQFFFPFCNDRQQKYTEIERCIKPFEESLLVCGVKLIAECTKFALIPASTDGCKTLSSKK